MSGTKSTQWYFCCTLLCLSNFLSQLVLFVYSFWFCFMGFICDFVCVRIYLCVQVCICVFIYLCACSMCACMCLCAYQYICVLCVYLFSHVCIVCVSVNVCVCWLVCVMYVCMGMYACVYCCESLLCFFLIKNYGFFLKEREKKAIKLGGWGGREYL